MSDVEVAISTVGEGAEVIRRQFGTARITVDKGGGDVATTADLEAEAAMLAVLRRERPADAVLGEEFGRTGRKDSVRVWLIDPLCGTQNYMAGMRVVAVNAALSRSGRVHAAAVADPFGGEIYWSDGHDSYARTEGRDVHLIPSGASRLVDLNFDPPFPNASIFRAVTLAADHAFLARFRPRVVSSSLAMTWVASGRRAAYVSDGDFRESVHFAAGLAICVAAGCVVSDLHGNPTAVGPYGMIVAAELGTHAAIVDLVCKQFAQ